MGRGAVVALQTDHYELTMVAASLESGIADRRAVFEAFARRLPEGRAYGVVAGIDRVVDAIGRFRFDDEAVGYLIGAGVISDGPMARWLRGYRFRGDVTGYPDGELFFPYSPVLTIEGSFAECVVLETVVLSILNHDCAVASAAARVQRGHSRLHLARGLDHGRYPSLDFVLDEHRPRVLQPDVGLRRGRRVSLQRGPRAEVVLDLAPIPGQELEMIVRLFIGQLVQYHHRPQPGQGFPQAVVVVAGRSHLIPHVMHEGQVEGPGRGGVAESAGEGPEYGQVGRALEIENPAGLLGLYVVFEADRLERLEHLMAAAVVDAVGRAHEGDYHIGAGRLVEQHLRVAGRDHLAPAGLGRFLYMTVDLALSQNLQVRVGLVEQQHGAGVGGVHI